MEEVLSVREKSEKYSDDKVIRQGEYSMYSLPRRKTLSRFTGYDLEEAYDDGGMWVINQIEEAIGHLQRNDINEPHLMLLHLNNVINKLKGK